MKLSNLNEWLSLTAHVGVLIGIAVVAMELQQTQTGMIAEASTLRAQMATDLRDKQSDNRVFELTEKIGTGQELSAEELDRAANFMTALMRFFENLQFQFELGVLDEEIWQSNLRGFSGLCRGSLYQYLYPDGFNDVTFRESFTELAAIVCQDEY